jgi:alanine racemase
MHTNSIIELNNTAYQKPLFSRTTFGKSTNLMCCKRKCLRPRSYRNRFNGVQNGITHFSVFDVEEAKIVKAELGDNDHTSDGTRSRRRHGMGDQ